MAFTRGPGIRLMLVPLPTHRPGPQFIDPLTTLRFNEGNQRRPTMGKYLLKVSYSAEGLKGVMKQGGTGRVRAVERAVAGVGGSLESLYFAFGADDVYVIVDVPNHAAAVAMAGAVATTGAISRYETVVLLTPAEIDEAMKVAVDYSPPGA